MKWSCDFETTTDANDCRVWAWGMCIIGYEEKTFEYDNSLESFIERLTNLNGDTFYFHNLRFDSSFILWALLKKGFNYVDDRKKLYKKSFTALISEMNLFYSIEICFENESRVKLLDSLKVIPLKVEEIPAAFGLEYKKLEIDYNKYRPIGYVLTPHEVEYLKHDIIIVAKALKKLFDEGLKKITTGSNALNQYKKMVGEKNFKRNFPILEKDKDIRQAYKGGFTYLNPKYKGITIKSGIVLDVNSLYPWVMYECLLPYGEAVFFKGEYMHDDLHNLYIQMLRCEFKLKENHIPCIQLKHSLRFSANEYIEESDGEIVLCLTNVDLQLFFDHYEVWNIEYLSGYKFKSTDQMFKQYIDFWIDIKIQSTLNGNNGMRTISKLMLNSLYGKFGTKPEVQGRIPRLEDDVLRLRLGDKKDKDPIYIPLAIFVTAWARNKTIRSAQSVYERFIYADTDSLHLEGLDLPENLEISDTELGKWKHEATFSKAKYLYQKTYIEEIDNELKITCAGMPKSCYEYVTFENFKTGTQYPGKLRQKNVVGGIILEEKMHTLRG